jgi:hypothetical protein
MPHLVKMDKKYRDKGLVLIGEEVQGTSEDKIKDFAKEHDVKFPLTKGSTGPRTGNGIPRIVVFDVEGNSVYVGHPSSDDCEKAIKEALKSATPPEGSEDSDGDDFFTRRELIPTRTWTNKDGNTLEAALVSLSGTTGTFRKPTGQTFAYETTNLSTDDQELISEQAGKNDD